MVRILQSPNKWVGFHPLYYHKQPGVLFFIAQVTDKNPGFCACPLNLGTLFPAAPDGGVKRHISLGFYVSEGLN